MEYESAGSKPSKDSGSASKAHVPQQRQTPSIDVVQRILQMQRTIGNRATRRLLQRNPRTTDTFRAAVLEESLTFSAPGSAVSDLGLLSSTRHRGDAKPEPTALDGTPIQRKIFVSGKKVSAHDVSHNLPISEPAERLLKPIYLEWLKTRDGRPREPVNNYEALRTALIRELTGRWTDEVKGELPELFAFLQPLHPLKFNTLVYLSRLRRGFSAIPLEHAFRAAQASGKIGDAYLRKVFAPGMLPDRIVGYNIFTDDWSALEPGVKGLVAELQVAAGIKPDEIMPHQKVAMGQDMQFGGTIGGQTSQDADVSYVHVSGAHVLVEVAATLDRLRDKMGTAGLDQRLRYERLVEADEGRVLAYSTPGTQWYEFFGGRQGEGIAERLPMLGIGWGLIIEGHYASPEELTGMGTKVRQAERKVPNFLAALQASKLGYDEVMRMDAEGLQKRLQRHARR